MHDSLTAGSAGAPVPAVPGYTELRRIGGGGFSTVYTAFQERFDRTVAVKVLHADLADARAERAFTRECRVTGRLGEHPHVITLYDAGSTSDRHPFIAMQHFPDGSFADRLRTGPPLPVDTALDVAAKVADALAEAHDQKILHRDVKPANILIARASEPVLSDFGIASVERGPDMTGNLAAYTPLHTAPEVIQGNRPTPASDIYSLGSTLYTLLEGRAPYAPQPRSELAAYGGSGVLLRMLADPFPRPSRSDLPASVVDLLKWVLDHTPANRPASVALFAAELRRAAANLAPSRTSTPPSAVGGGWVGGGPVGGGPVGGGPVGGGLVGGATADPPTLPAPGGFVPAGRQSSPPEAGQPSSLPVGRLVLVVSASTVVVVLLLVGIGAMVGHLRARAAGSGQPDSAVNLEQSRLGTSTPTVSLPPPSGERADSRSAGPPPAEVGPAELDAARPRSVRVVREVGAVVDLAWTNGGGGYPVVVQATSTDGRSVVTPVPDGAESVELTGLDPDGGYCFLVTAVLSASPLTTAQSDPPLCIRGAYVRG